MVGFGSQHYESIKWTDLYSQKKCILWLCNQREGRGKTELDRRKSLVPLVTLEFERIASDHEPTVMQQHF